MKNRTGWLITGLSTCALAAAAMLATGCATTQGTPVAQEASLGNGPQLWAQDCMRCHNLQSPSKFSDAQWTVVSMHMRLRANLTAHDYDAILAFLKTAH
jgi:hypothetical protein